MAEKPMPKHKKMYANSPTLESDETGKKYIKKNSPSEAEKTSAQVNDGTAGMPLHEVHIKHEKERHALYLKQSAEFMDMHAKHMTEAGPGATAGGADGATGGDMIDKTQNNEKE